MNTKLPSLEFGGLLHHILQDLVLYYLSSIIFIILLSTYFVTWIRERRSLVVPFYGLDRNDKDAPKKRWMRDSINLLQEGYRKFQDKPFQVWTTEGNHVVLPPKLIDEVKMFRDDTLPSSLVEILQAKHTTFGGADKPIPEADKDFLPRILKHNLNKNLPLVLPEMENELKVGLSIEFPPCNDWEAVKVTPKMANLISRISGRVFVGPDLNRDETWLNISVTYTRDAFESASRIRTWRPSLRWIAKYFIPEIRRMHDHNAKATAFIGEIMKQRACEEKAEGYKKPNDALQWVRDALPETKRGDMRLQSTVALALGAAAINTTSMLITNVIYDLAFRPEYIEMLRGEVREVLQASNGHLAFESMSNLRKMDSFIKESQRHSAVVTSFNRKTAKNITLSDGTFLPRNTYIMAPALAISADPLVYPNADCFDGLRYYHLRQQSLRDENRYQFTTVDKNMVHFGAGRHACPGRWFASVEIKLILATLILQYDIRLKDGKRPKSILFQSQHLPDPNAEVLFKRRKLGD